MDAQDNGLKEMKADVTILKLGIQTLLEFKASAEKEITELKEKVLELEKASVTSEVQISPSIFLRYEHNNIVDHLVGLSSRRCHPDGD